MSEFTLEFEEWKDIPGYEGSYQVSNLGKIRSLDRIVTYVDGHRQRKGGTILVQGTRPDGYRTVGLGNGDSTTATFRVYVLVALAFIGPRPEGNLIRHIDGDKENNRVSNLKYGTKRDNYNDAIAHIGYFNSCDKQGNSNLTHGIVVDIRKEYRTGVTQKYLSRKYKVSPGHIGAIVRNETWVDGVENLPERIVRSRKLTEQEAIEILDKFKAATQRYGTQTRLAKEYNVTLTTINLLVNGNSHRHLHEKRKEVQ